MHPEFGESPNSGTGVGSPNVLWSHEKEADRMSSYAEMSYRCKQARSLYLELRALGLELRAEDDLDEPLGYRITVGGLRSLSPFHADRVMRLVWANEIGLVMILLNRCDADLRAIRTEGRCT